VLVIIGRWEFLLESAIDLGPKCKHVFDKLLNYLQLRLSWEIARFCYELISKRAQINCSSWFEIAKSQKLLIATAKGSVTCVCATLSTQLMSPV
jgi:hypothetical protein